MMKEGQLLLIPNTYNPLVDRLGAGFFEEIPKNPGVYKMLGEESDLLYVGKAKNLRTRLMSYRRARTGRVSRKTVRLLREVRHISYECCGSEREALLLENRLIRTERPPYNRAKKSPETYYFIHFRVAREALFFKLNMNGDESEEWHSYGAFKGHRFTRRAMGALLRLCYLRAHAIRKACEFPLVLVRNLTPLNYRLELPDTGEMDVLEDLLDRYLSGREDTFSEGIYSRDEDAKLSGFTRNLAENDAEILERFFNRRTRFNHEMTREYERDSHLIPQDELDDMISRFRSR